MQNKAWKINYIACLAAIYVVSTLLFTVGYFTPWWLVKYQRDIYDTWDDYLGRKIAYTVNTELCTSVGLITGHCRYPFHDLSKTGWHLGLILRLCFYFMLAAAVFLYVNALLLSGAVFLKLYKNEVYMSFLAISCGVLYPLSGVFTVFSSTIVISTYGKLSGFSAFCTLIAGFLMLLCYTGLRIYDYMHIKAVSRKKMKTFG